MTKRALTFYFSYLAVTYEAVTPFAVGASSALLYHFARGLRPTHIQVSTQSTNSFALAVAIRGIVTTILSESVASLILAVIVLIAMLTPHEMLSVPLSGCFSSFVQQKPSRAFASHCYDPSARPTGAPFALRGTRALASLPRLSCSWQSKCSPAAEPLNSPRLWFGAGCLPSFCGYHIGRLFARGNRLDRSKTERFRGSSRSAPPSSQGLCLFIIC